MAIFLKFVLLALSGATLVLVLSLVCLVIFRCHAVAQRHNSLAICKSVAMAARRSRDLVDEHELQSAIEIPDLPGSIATIQDNGAIDQQLERADGGAAAWTILCAAFMFEALLWGEQCISSRLGQSSHIHIQKTFRLLSV